MEAWLELPDDGPDCMLMKLEDYSLHRRFLRRFIGVVFGGRVVDGPWISVVRQTSCF